MLTEEQRFEFTQIPQNISEWEIAKYYTFTDNDMEIINQHRRDYNRLGFAVQLCCLRNPGWSLNNKNSIPYTVLSYIAEQLQANPNEFEQYGQRENARLKHLQELREAYGFRNFLKSDYEYLLEYLMPYAMENDNVIRLIRITIEELKRRMVILPGITTLERIVNKVSKTADETVIKIINESLTDAQKHKLNELVESPNETFRTNLAYLKEDPGQSSPKAFTGIIDRLEVIRKIGLNLNIESIHPNRVKQLSRLGSKYEPHIFRRFEESKRYAILALYLYDLSQSLTDLAVEIHDKQINILLSKGRKKQEEIQKQNGKTLNEKVIQFVDIGSALIKAKNEGLDPFITVETVMPWDKIIESVEEAKKLARPVNYDYLDLLDNRYNYLRKYTPALVKYLEFSSTNRSLEPLIDALKIINNMNETGKKKVPDDAPLVIVTK